MEDSKWGNFFDNPNFFNNIVQDYLDELGLVVVEGRVVAGEKALAKEEKIAAGEAEGRGVKRMIEEDVLDALIDRWAREEGDAPFEFTGITREVDGTYSWGVYRLIKNEGQKTIKGEAKSKPAHT